MKPKNLSFDPNEVELVNLDDMEAMCACSSGDDQPQN